MLPLTPILRYYTLSIMMVSICPCFMWPMHETIGMDPTALKWAHKATDSYSAQRHSTMELRNARDDSQGHYVTSASSQSSGKPSSNFVTYILNMQRKNTQNNTEVDSEREIASVVNSTRNSSLNVKPSAFSNQNYISQGNSMNSRNIHINNNDSNNKDTYHQPPSLPGTTVDTESFHLPDRISNLGTDTARISREFHQGTSPKTNSFLVRSKRSGNFGDMHSRPVISFKDNEIDLKFPLQSLTQESYSVLQRLEAMTLPDLIESRLAKIGFTPASIDVELGMPFFLKREDVLENADVDEGTRLSALDEQIRNDAGQNDVVSPDDVTRNPFNILLSDVEANSISKRGGRIFNYLRQMDGRMKERKPLRSRAGYPLSMRKPRLRHNSESIVRRQPYRQPLPILAPVSTSDYSSSCKPEADGLKPLTCPSAKEICLYDAMMCDGKKDCPMGEDESFPLCAIRHWTYKIQRRLQALESRGLSSRRVG